MFSPRSCRKQDTRLARWQSRCQPRAPGFLTQTRSATLLSAQCPPVTPWPVRGPLPCGLFFVLPCFSCPGAPVPAGLERPGSSCCPCLSPWPSSWLRQFFQVCLLPACTRALGGFFNFGCWFRAIARAFGARRHRRAQPERRGTGSKSAHLRGARRFRHDSKAPCGLPSWSWQAIGSVFSAVFFALSRRLLRTMCRLSTAAQVATGFLSLVSFWASCSHACVRPHSVGCLLPPSQTTQNGRVVFDPATLYPAGPARAAPFGACLSCHVWFGCGRACGSRVFSDRSWMVVSPSASRFGHSCICLAGLMSSGLGFSVRGPGSLPRPSVAPAIPVRDEEWCPTAEDRVIQAATRKDSAHQKGGSSSWSQPLVGGSCRLSPCFSDLPEIVSHLTRFSCRPIFVFRRYTKDSNMRRIFPTVGAAAHVPRHQCCAPTALASPRTSSGTSVCPGSPALDHVPSGCFAVDSDEVVKAIKSFTSTSPNRTKEALRRASAKHSRAYSPK